MMYQIVAAMLLLAFYGCYFGKMLLQKRKGIQTDQMGKGKTGTALHIERTLKLTTIAVVAGEVISLLLGITVLPDGLRWAGLILTAIGTGVFIVSVVTMRDSWRAGVAETDKTDLITAGIYSISRNPAFLGFDLVYAGILLTFFSWWLAALTVFAIIVLHVQITRVEEPFLRMVFGKDYRAYESQVCRYLGRH